MIVKYINRSQEEIFKKLILKTSGQIKSQKWNSKSREFWKGQQASYSGVLLGQEQISNIDIEFSKNFMERLRQKQCLKYTKSVIDCGAGIGRVSKQLLSNYFLTIDTLDQTQQFVNTSKILLQNVGIRHFYCQTLQEFQFEHQYDCVWIQWTLTHLRKQDSIKFLTKAKQNIAEKGLIIVKQNVAQNKSIVDYSDSTIVRTDKEWKSLFYDAKLNIIEQQFQSPWPSDLEKVKMYALV